MLAVLRQGWLLLESVDGESMPTEGHRWRFYKIDCCDIIEVYAHFMSLVILWNFYLTCIISQPQLCHLWYAENKCSIRYKFLTQWCSISWNYQCVVQPFKSFPTKWLLVLWHNVCRCQFFLNNRYIKNSISSILRLSTKD